MENIIKNEDNKYFGRNRLQEPSEDEENLSNQNLSQSDQDQAFEQFTGQYIEDNIQALKQKKQELLDEQEQKIQEIKQKYSKQLNELDEALQLLKNISTNMNIESKKPEKPKYKVKKENLKENEIILDLSSVNLPFEFTPTVPYKLDPANKQNFKKVEYESNNNNMKIYEPKNSDQYLKFNIQQQLDLGRFTPFVFQPNLKN